MTISFDHATAVTAIGDGRYAADVSPTWTIGGERPHGGYLLAILGRAAVDAAGVQPHPLAVNVQYVVPPRLGEAVVETEVLRTGRFASNARARLVQGGQTCVDAMFVLGTLHEGVDPWWGASPPVELPPEEECRRLTTLPVDVGSDTGRPTFRDAVSLSFDPATLSWADGEGDGTGELRAWFRLGDGREVDPIALLFVVDALPPATFAITRTGWVPTMNLTAYVRAIPAAGPLRLRFRANVIQDGVVDEAFEAWDSAGRLVAQSTQLAGIRVPT